MASEIEEINADLPPRYVNPHNDNSMKNNNYYSNRNSDDNNGNTDIKGEVNGNSNGERKEDKKKDGRKCTSTRVLCWGWLTTRKSVKSSSTKEKENVDIKSEHKGNNSSYPLKLKLDAHPPDNYSPEEFQQKSDFVDFRAKFEVLGSLQKKCLSSFMLFPENTELKKTLLVKWWIAEGFLESKPQGKKLEDSATEILKEFVEKKFILPVYKRFQKVANSFKLDPVIHYAMILLGKSMNSISDGNIFSWFDNWVCLEKSNPLKLKSLQKGKTSVNVDEVKTLFNVGQRAPDFALKSFSTMENVQVLYLGKWQSSDEHHHIDVTNSEFLKGLKNMKKLRFLSLQGISGIQELPSSISNLTSLEILDLRACYNLEKLPEEIGSLKKVTHLDISECYLLDCMPRELLSLTELQVLKGFVITDTKNKSFCTLADLSGLKKLEKLSVNLNSVNFLIDKFSVVLKFKPLLKLKITWGGKVSIVQQNKNSKKEKNEAKSNTLIRPESAVGEVRSSGTKLEKLELLCLPHKTLPNWVTPENLTSLKKLYIRGGGLQSLGEIDNEEWNVEVLRLKYLTQLKINWRELMTMFPKLQCLEKFKCPKAILFPCDCYGVWVKPPTRGPAAQPQTTP